MATNVTQENNKVTIKINIQEDGANVNLDGATDIHGDSGGVTFVLLNSDGTKRIQKDASDTSITSDSNGEVELVLAAEDLDMAGTWYVQVGFTLGTFSGWTEPKEFKVDANLRPA